MFQHPSNVCMTYLEHFAFSASLSITLAIGAYKALIHAIWPDAYITSTSDLVAHMDRKLKAAGCR